MGRNTVPMLLYALGALLGVAAVFYFGFEIIQQFSPATKSSLLGLGFAAFIMLGSYVSQKTVSGVMYVLAAGTYLVFLAYTFSVFTFSSDAIFLSLAASSILFISLGYLYQQGSLEIPRKTAQYTLLAILAAAVMLAVFDILGPQPTVTTTFNDTVNLSASSATQPIHIGEMTATNAFLLPRDVDSPRYRACLYINGQLYPDILSVRDPVTRLPGTSEDTMPITYFPARAIHENATQHRGVIPIEQRDTCPDTVQDNRLIIATETEGPFLVRRSD